MKMCDTLIVKNAVVKPVSCVMSYRIRNLILKSKQTCV